MRTDWIDMYGRTPRYASDEIPDSLYEAFRQSASGHSDKVALEHGTSKITYGNLLKEVDRAAEVFRGIGIVEGTLVSLCLPAIPSMVISIYALNKIGASVSFLDSRMSPESFSGILSLTGSEYVLMTVAQMNEYAPVMKDTPVKHVILSRYKDYGRFYDNINVFVRELFRKDKVTYEKDDLKGVKVYEWTSLMSREAVSGEASDKAAGSRFYFHIGIDSTHSNSVVLTSSTINAASYLTEFEFDYSGLPKGSTLRVMSCVEKAFVYGMTFINSTLVSGNTLLLHARIPISLPENDILFYRPDVVAGYPTVIYEFKTSSRLRGRNLDFLKLVFVGGHVLPGNKYNELEIYFRKQGWKAKIIRNYGPAETGAVCMFDPPDFDNPQAAGIPLPGVLVKICDRDAYYDVPVGATGAVCIHSPAMMDGYFNPGPGVDKDVFIQFPDGRKWMVTDDNGHTDEKGYFYFDGSLKRIIMSDGFFVYPTVVESVIGQIEGVDKVCVIEDPKNGNGRLIALVMPLEDVIVDADRLIELKEMIMKECSKIFQPYMIPSVVEFRAYLPLDREGRPDSEEIVRQLKETLSENS